MQSKQAGLLPVYLGSRASIRTGKMVYQDLNQAPGMGDFHYSLQRWVEYGGLSGSKILTSLLTLTDGEASQIGGYTNYFMVRMQGYIRLAEVGTWVLHAYQDDYLAVRLGTVTGYHNSPSGSVSQICTYNAVGTGWVPFDMIYQENSGGQGYGFYLQGPSDAGYRELRPSDVGYSQNLLTEDFTY